jgi:hypothetical protein
MCGEHGSNVYPSAFNGLLRPTKLSPQFGETIGLLYHCMAMAFFSINFYDKSVGCGEELRAEFGFG